MSRTIVALCAAATLIAAGCQKEQPQQNSTPPAPAARTTPSQAPKAQPEDLQQASQALKEQVAQPPAGQTSQSQLPPGHPPIDQLGDQARRQAENLKQQAATAAKKAIDQAASKLPPGHPPIEQLKENAKQKVDEAAAKADLPPGHPPLDDLKKTAQQKAGELTGDAELPAGHPAIDQVGKVLNYTAPEGWQAQKPASRMRKAQFALPGPEGSEPGELIIYYFGKGQGGPVGDNLKRWRAMFVDDEGKPVGDDAVDQQELEVNGLKVTVLDVRGTLQASVMPGVAPTTSTRPKQRMLAAIIETPDGPWFIKAVGPEDTMASQYENFMKFIKSVKY